MIKFQGQFRQDQFLYEHFFSNKKGGVFVDIGAYDGITHSKTWVFEKNLGWTGICIEPLRTAFNKLEQQRSCVCIRGCIYDQEGEQSFLELNGGFEICSGLVQEFDPRNLKFLTSQMELGRAQGKLTIVPCYRLPDILKKQQIEHIDLLCLDTEGCEFKVLQTVDFDQLSVNVLAIPDLWPSTERHNYLTSQGFQRIDRRGCDAIYQHKRFRNTESTGGKGA